MTRLEAPGFLATPAVALTVLAFAAGLWSPTGPGLTEGTAVAAVLLLSLWIAWQDLTDFTIPDAAVIALACFAVAARLTNAFVAEGNHSELVLSIALDGLAAGGSMLAVRELYFRRRGIDGLGFGDVKLAAAGGLLVGLTSFAIALLAASLAGLVLALYEAWRTGALDPRRRIAFGALLAPSLALVWLVGRPWALSL